MVLSPLICRSVRIVNRNTSRHTLKSFAVCPTGLASRARHQPDRSRAARSGGIISLLRATDSSRSHRRERAGQLARWWLERNAVDACVHSEEMSGLWKGSFAVTKVAAGSQQNFGDKISLPSEVLETLGSQLRPDRPLQVTIGAMPLACQGCPPACRAGHSAIPCRSRHPTPQAPYL